MRTIVRWLRQIFLISKRKVGGISGNLHTTVRIQSAVASQVGQQSFNNTVKNNRKTIKPKSRRRKGNRDDTAAMLISRPTRLVAAVQSTHDRCATSWRGTPSPQRYRLARSRIDRFSYSCTVLDSHPSMLFLGFWRVAILPWHKFEPDLRRSDAAEATFASDTPTSRI